MALLLETALYKLFENFPSGTFIWGGTSIRDTRVEELETPNLGISNLSPKFEIIIVIIHVKNVA